MKSFKAWMTQWLFFVRQPHWLSKTGRTSFKRTILEITFALVKQLIFKLLYCYQGKKNASITSAIIQTTWHKQPVYWTNLRQEQYKEWYINCVRWHFKLEEHIPMTLGQCHAELPHSLASLSSLSSHQTEALCWMPFPSLTQAGGSVPDAVFLRWMHSLTYSMWTLIQASANVSLTRDGRCSVTLLK